MKITVKEWILFVLIAALCFGIWLRFGYRQLSFVDLSIDRGKALKIAESSLRSLGVNAGGYSRAVAFDNDDWADRYLQKTIGPKSEEEFIKKHGYELFFWKIRFFKQFQKEEYIIEVGSASGEIISFEHLLEDVALRETVDQSTAKLNAQEFLKNKFGIDLNEFDFHEEKAKRYEKRIDYTFSWQKKGVYIPWKKDEGGARLLIGATISGNGISKFYKNKLDVPEKFRRYIDNQLAFGEYLYSFYFIVLMFLVTSSAFIVLKKRSNVIMKFCKIWFLSVAAIIILINLVFIFNDIQSILIHYSTSISLGSFLGIYVIKEMIYLLLIGITFAMSGIAGESLHNELFKPRQNSSFMHYLKSSFYCRAASRAVFLGYCLFFILIGVQAAIFYLGQKYLGVWKEWFRLSQFSSAYFPFLSAFVIGINASFNEEVLFRLFGISWGKKYLKNTVLAIIFSSLIWGFGHSQYAIFPVWFRGIEVTILGLIYGFIFIRYGLIPLIVAHYLFDVFWGVAAYILGHTTKYLFTSSLFVLAIPLIFALIAYLKNGDEKERDIKTVLDDTQKYNLSILMNFISAKKSQGLGAQAIKGELIEHNWDLELVDLGINEIFKEK